MSITETNQIIDRKTARLECEIAELRAEKTAATTDTARKIAADQIQDCHDEIARLEALRG